MLQAADIVIRLNPADDVVIARVDVPAGTLLLRENVGVVYPEFPTRSIDSRFPGWDPPEQARTALCNFRVIEATERWRREQLEQLAAATAR